MKYDPSTANVDRWHGMTDEDMSRGFKKIDGVGFATDSSNSKQLNGGMQPRDRDSLEEQSD